MAITRPLTALAFAIPIGVVVIWQTSRTHQWRQLLRPALVGVAIVSLLTLSSARDTGSWRVSPYSLYAREYMPFDKMGFGLDSAPAERSLPSDMQGMAKAFSPIHAKHTVDRLPSILYDRWHWMFVDAFRGNRLPLAVFAIIALAVLPYAGWFAIGSSLLLTLCYLGYAHDASWDLYYLEIIPLFPFLTACGIWGLWLALRRRGKGIRQNFPGAATAQAALAGLIMCALWLGPALGDVVVAQQQQATRRAYQAGFFDAAARLPEPHTIVFVRYAPWHSVHTSLIANHADLSGARTWFVYDRGAQNASLIALAPGRTPYLFDERAGTLQRLIGPASNSP
jgi:hypothetical protein